MKTIVIYDSVFGNTKIIADEIAKATGGALFKVTDICAADLNDATHIFVGSPTRAFRPTAAVSAWLKKLPAGALKGVNAAAFDTRAIMETVDSAMLKRLAKWFGYAAEKICKELKKKGATTEEAPIGFYVMESEGPLKDGELKRAASWAERFIKV